MQIYSKKKVENLVIDELVRQGFANKKEHFNTLITLEKLINTKKKPIYLISFSAEHMHDWVETARVLQSVLIKNNVKAILIPSFSNEDGRLQVREIKG